MPKALIPDSEFIELWNTHQSATKLAKIIGIATRCVFVRRRAIEKRLGITLKAQDTSGLKFDHLHPSKTAFERKQLGIANGSIIIFSDAHFWPGIHTTAFKGLLWAIKEFKPKFVICNGDAFDGASISRHPPIGWGGTPSVISELDACTAALGEIVKVAKKARSDVRLIYTWGNHDQRFATRLATNAAEFAEVKGFRLEDHLSDWEFCMTVWATDDVVIKHRYKGGIHATHNNTAAAGKTIVTGHLHSLKVTPYADYNGNRFGVDTGTLAEPYGPQFSYGEDAPINHRSGFAMLTFKDGALLWPELVHKWSEGHVEFRGQVIKV